MSKPESSAVEAEIERRARELSEWVHQLSEDDEERCGYFNAATLATVSWLFTQADNEAEGEAVVSALRVLSVRLAALNEG